MNKLSPLEEKTLEKIITRLGTVSKNGIRKMPKVEILQVDKSAEDCVAMLSSCLETPNAIGCSINLLPQFLECIAGGNETLVTNVPCGNEQAGTHYLPYSVYKDWLRCTFEQSGGKAECDDFTFEDEVGRTITTKVSCDCPGEKSWDGHGCKCPEFKPYDEFRIEEEGGQMINGPCCAEHLCGEGGFYDCDIDKCLCAPGWFEDGQGGCTNDPCLPGVAGGSGCDTGSCCQTIGVCVINDGVWDGQGDTLAPKTISGCEAAIGNWINTDTGKCPFEGHCELSICDINQTYGGANPNRFAISECDPHCLADKCQLACDTADESECGGKWVFDSCDNKGSPATCLCACVPD